MRVKASAFLKAVDLPAIQTGTGSVGVGLLYSSQAVLLPADRSFVGLFFAFAGIVFILFYIMALNDYFDVEIDKLKEERHALAEIPKRVVAALVVVFLNFGLLFAWLASPIYFVISLVLVLLSTAYSAPPVRYKEVYPFSTLGEVTGGFFLFLAGYSLLAPIEVRALSVSLIPCLIVAYGRLRHEVRFVKFDKETGKKTLAVVHGVGKVRLLMRFCILLMVALCIGLFLAGWFSLTFLSFFVLFLVGSFHTRILKKMAPSTYRRELWLTENFWGFGYFFLVVAWILSYYGL